MIIFLILCDFSSGDTLSTTLRMDAISPQIGSMEGGTRLIIAGEGFGTDKDDVSLHEDYNEKYHRDVVYKYMPMFALAN